MGRAMGKIRLKSFAPKLFSSRKGSFPCPSATISLTDGNPSPGRFLK